MVEQGIPEVSTHSGFAPPGALVISGEIITGLCTNTPIVRTLISSPTTPKRAHLDLTEGTPTCPMHG